MPTDKKQSLTTRDAFRQPFDNNKNAKVVF